MRSFFTLCVSMVISVSAASADNKSIREMPTDFLCSVIAPPAKIEHSEQLAIKLELERRGYLCVNTKKS